MLIKKFLYRLILLCVLFLLLMPTALAKVNTYTGVGEDFASQFESQDVSKLRAKNYALRQALSQANSALAAYSRSKNFKLNDNEINAISTSTYELIGQVSFEHFIKKLSDSSTVIVWKATVNISLDDNSLKNWFALKSDEKLNIINQTKDVQDNINSNNQQLERLRSRLKNASAKDKATIKAELKKIDNEFLAINALDEANRFFHRKNFNGALKKYNEALKFYPSYAKAYYNRAVLYRTLNNFEKAIADYSEAIKLKPDYVNAYNNRGVIYNNLNNFDGALADYSKVIELNPNYEYAYNNRGNTYYYLKDYNRALADFNKAIELNPNQAKYYFNRANVLLKLENYTQAINDYSAAIVFNPKYIDAFFNRALAYTKLKKYSLAINDYTSVINLDPNDKQAYHNRGLCYQALGDLSRAQADFNM